MADAPQTTTDPVAAWVARLNATPHCTVLEVVRETDNVRLRMADPRTGRLGILTYYLDNEGALHVDPRDFFEELGRPGPAGHGRPTRPDLSS